MAVVDVSLDYISSDIANRTEKLSRTPKMPFTKMIAKPRKLAEKLVRTAAFKQLKSFRNAHGRGQTDKHMDMVWFNLKLMNFHIMSFSNFKEKLLAALPNCLKFKWVSGIFRLPHKVEAVLSYAVSMFVKSFHFMLSPRFFCGANADSKVVECASYAAHSSLFFDVRKSLWRLGYPCAKAQGILCM